jgi:hypothetical protein
VLEVKKQNVNELIEEKSIFTKQIETKNTNLTNEIVVMDEVIHTVKNKKTVKQQFYDQSANFSESFDNIESLPLAEIVKNILTRPNVTARRLSSNLGKNLYSTSSSSYELNRCNNLYDKKQPLIVKNNLNSDSNDLKATSLIINNHYNSDRNIKKINNSQNEYNFQNRKSDKSSINIRSRSSGPINKILAATATGGIILEKKSIDKFLKLASNSASQLDINHQVQLSHNGTTLNNHKISSSKCFQN